MGRSDAGRVAAPVLAGALLVGLAAVSGAAVLVRLAPDVSAPVAAAWRLTIASLVMGAAACVVHRPRGVRAALSGRGRVVAIAGVCLGAHFALWFASLHRTSVTTSVVLVTTAPVQAALFERAFFGERLGRVRWLGIAIGAAGAITLALAGAHEGRRDTLSGDLLALGGATAAAGYYLAGRRARADVPLLPYAAGAYTVAAALVLVLALGVRLPLTGFAAHSIAALVALALVPQVIGHTTLNWALRHLPAASVTGVTLGEPIGASILAAALLGGRPPAMALAGGALSLAGVALVLFGGGARLAARTAAEPVAERAGGGR